MACGAIQFLIRRYRAQPAQSSPNSSSTVDVGKVAPIAAQLPPKISNAGKLTIGVNVPYAPNEFKDDSR